MHHQNRLRGKRQVVSLTTAKRGSVVTMVSTMSASGISARFNGKMPIPSEWIQANLFTNWFNSFVNKTHPNEASPVLLIMDDHY
ncbi:hypothetical protein GWI33_004907 [Rhynchophorus ferrugineus]|uniref:DDE-1 domain-containing protein n=1 Tax=Rhynchophorus ferrugineus TaxID=354439 RepID=A0A834IL17_RHYFE|nr:hypothetical protein GWI33_004907 [Rhynchophorus ferrugineus]